MDNVLSNLTELVADGHFWHKLSDQMRIKYGTDWKHRMGFDFNKLTKDEQVRYVNTYKATMSARGVTNVTVNF